MLLRDYVMEVSLNSYSTAIIESKQGNTPAMSDTPGVSQPQPLRKRGRDDDAEEDQVQQALLVETASNSINSLTPSEQRSFKRAKVTDDSSASTANLHGDDKENMGMDVQSSHPSGSKSQTLTPNITHAPITLENTPPHALPNSPNTLSTLQAPLDLEYPLPPRPAQDHDMTDAEVQAISLHGQRMGLIKTASGEEADEHSPQYLRASRRARKRQRALDRMPNPLKGCPVTTLPFELIAEVRRIQTRRSRPHMIR